MKLKEWLKKYYADRMFEANEAFFSGREEAIGEYRREMLGMGGKNDHIRPGAYYLENNGKIEKLAFISITVWEPEAFEDACDVVCLWICNCHGSSDNISSMVSQFPMLECLSLNSIDYIELPEKVQNMQFLEVLDLSYSDIKFLPEELSLLSGLLVLNLNGSLVEKLPEEIGRLKKLSSLVMNNTRITCLPESVGQLANLRKLSASDNKIRTLPETLGNLKLLKELYLDYTEIQRLPESIGNLRELGILLLNNTNITYIPEEIGKLEKLGFLVIAETEVEELPEGLWNLDGLFTLDISHTRIKKFPEQVGGLQQLCSLDLSYTEITRLPDAFTVLPSLKFLNLAHCRITELPDTLYSMNLSHLNLSGLKLETISSRILDMGLKFSLDGRYKEKRCVLKDTEIWDMNVQMFGRSREELALYFSDLEKHKVLLNEVRVIFVGDGEAGKSTVINRIITGEYVEKLEETKGVLIRHWRDPREEENPNIVFWDFGGQAIMHSMHEFFMGERCFYVVVLDGRRDESPEYWLDIISQYGKSSSVMVVMNKIDQNRHAGIDAMKLKREYKGIFENMYFCQISCKTAEGFEEFEDLFGKAVKKMASCRKAFPEKWYHVRQELYGMKKNYIHEDEYRSICRKYEITEEYPQNIILSWMSDLGVCFSYRSRHMFGSVEDLKVLRPEWITNGVYKIITSKEARDYNGFMNHELIREILERKDDVNERYHNTERDFILGMMRDFMLSYQIGNSEFIPMLTTEEEPELPDMPEAADLQLEYKIPVSAAVLYRFIVSMKQDVVCEKTWRRGTYLKNTLLQTVAIVRFGKTRKIVDIHVSGKNPSLYLAMVRHALLSAQSDLVLEYSEYIFYTNARKKTARLKLERELAMLEKGILVDYADDIGEQINIYEALASIVPDQTIYMLRELLKGQQKELSEMREQRFSVEELKNHLFAIDSRITEIALMVNSIEKMTKLQISQLTSLCSQLTDQCGNETLQNALEALREEVRKGNRKGIKDKLNGFLAVASGIVTLYTGCEPIWQDIMQLLQQFGLM